MSTFEHPFSPNNKDPYGAIGRWVEANKKNQEKADLREASQFGITNGVVRWGIGGCVQWFDFVYMDEADFNKLDSTYDLVKNLQHDGTVDGIPLTKLLGFNEAHFLDGNVRNYCRYNLGKPGDKPNSLHRTVNGERRVCIAMVKDVLTRGQDETELFIPYDIWVCRGVRNRKFFKQNGKLYDWLTGETLKEAVLKHRGYDQHGPIMEPLGPNHFEAMTWDPNAYEPHRWEVERVLIHAPTVKTDAECLRWFRENRVGIEMAFLATKGDVDFATEGNSWEEDWDRGRSKLPIVEQLPDWCKEGHVFRKKIFENNHGDRSNYHMLEELQRIFVLSSLGLLTPQESVDLMFGRPLDLSRFDPL